MHFELIKPPATLAGYVKSFWVMECDNIRDQPYLYHAMADGCPELVFHYHGGFNELLANGIAVRPSSYVIGQTSIFSRQTATGAFGIFGAYLFPFALPRIFSMPASEFSNQVAGLNILPGTGWRDIEDRIMLAKNNEERVGILSAFLEGKIYGSKYEDKGVTAAVRYILKERGGVDVKSLSAWLNISTRQFERKFKIHSGFSPKLFTRIVRFQATLNEIRNPHKTLTDICYECGYYDQSHFIHDFKEFSGVHPGLYFSGNADGTEVRASI